MEYGPAKSKTTDQNTVIGALITLLCMHILEYVSGRNYVFVVVLILITIGNVDLILITIVLQLAPQIERIPKLCLLKLVIIDFNNKCGR